MRIFLTIFDSRRMSSEATTAAAIARLEREIQQLKLQKINTEGTKERVVIEKDPPPERALGLKPSKLPKYDGNKCNYPAWRAAVLDTFRMDWLAFGYDNSRAFLMIYRALKGKALKKAGPFYETGGVCGTRNPEDFIEFLDRWNLDPMRVSRANDELHVMRMGEKEGWSDFFASWSNKLTEARGDMWDDQNKISMLRNSLNNRLLRALVGNTQLPSDNFNGWIEIVNQVAQQLEMVEDRSRKISSKQGNGVSRDFMDFGTTTPNRPSNTGRQTDFKGVNYERTRPEVRNEQNWPLEQGDVDASGDTVMGGINTIGIGRNKPLRAKWKTQAELDRLRTERRCFRCERKGCTANRCPLKPAKRPKSEKGLQVNVASLPPIDPTVCDLEDSEDSNNESIVDVSEN